MRIAQVAPLHEAVPPKLYGGTERIVSYLTEELVKMGHEVTLFASGDSVTSAKLEPMCERALRLDERIVDPLAPHVRMIGQVSRRAHDFEVIHCHTDYIGLPALAEATAPAVITLHGRLDIPEIWPLYREHASVPLVSISESQRTPMPDAPWIATVHHGMPEELFEFRARPDDYLLFLGRIAPEKRPDAAIRIARRAGRRLVMAAKIDRADREYHQSVVAPLLREPGIEFLGEVGDADKRELLSKAAALLFPIDWPEPFGLVMIEALASGTPVVARRRGSVPEVLEDGVTGFLCETEEEMVSAVSRLDALDRSRCRAAYQGRFTAQAMADRYVAVYRAVVGVANETTAPRTDRPLLS